MISPETLAEIEKYLKTSITTREPKSKSAFCRSKGISVPTFNKYEVEFRRKGKLSASPSLSDIDDLPIEEKVKIFDKLLFELIQDPKTPSKDRELFAKRYGLLVDKTEHTVTFEISADEHFRIREEARRRLSEVSGGADGNRGLLPEHTLLPPEIRQDTG